MNMHRKGPDFTPALASRREIEAAIEELIAHLDQIDGDCDLEEDGTEHDQSWSERGPGAYDYDRLRGFEYEDAEENDPAEPSLGWPETGTGITPAGYIRTRRSAPADLDLEYDECESEEGEDLEGDELDTSEGDPEEDREPALGWNAEASQAFLMSTVGGDISGLEDEPSLGSAQGSVSVPQGGLHWWSPPSLTATGGPHRYDRDGSQEHWGHQANALTDAEEEHDGAEPENEHGGDVQDEPHDAEDEDTGVGDRDALMAEDFFGGAEGHRARVYRNMIATYNASEGARAKILDVYWDAPIPIVSSSLPGFHAGWQVQP